MVLLNPKRHGSLCFSGSYSRLFFAGASSALFPSGAARILPETYSRARRCDQRSLHHLPLGFGAIRRVERVSLPDGTTYSLYATWTKDPHFKITKSPPRHQNMCPRNQDLVHPVLKKGEPVEPILQIRQLRS